MTKTIEVLGKSKTCGVRNGCGHSIYLEYTDNRKYCNVTIGKNSSCIRSFASAISILMSIISQTSILIGHLLKGIASGDIEFKKKDEKEYTLKKLNELNHTTSIANISEKLSGIKCSSQGINDGVTVESCADGIAKCLKMLEGK